MPNASPALRKHWRYNRRITALCLLIWLALILGTVFFARTLNEYTFLNVPLAYYLFAQGIPLAFLALIESYAALMNYADLQFTEQNQEHSRENTD